MKDIKIDDVKEELVDIVEFMGIGMFIEFCERFGGSHIYIPNKKSLYRNSRNREIKRKYDGTNSKELSREFGISENHLRLIVKSNI